MGSPWEVRIDIFLLVNRMLRLCTSTGVVAQQLVLLPFHPMNPVSLPFRVTHVLLTGTMVAPLNSPPTAIKPRPEGSLTSEQKLALVREGVELSFDPVWIGDVKNKERLEWFVKRMAVDRPARTVRKFAILHA